MTLSLKNDDVTTPSKMSGSLWFFCVNFLLLHWITVTIFGKKLSPETLFFSYTSFRRILAQLPSKKMTSVTSRWFDIYYFFRRRNTQFTLVCNFKYLAHRHHLQFLSQKSAVVDPPPPHCAIPLVKKIVLSPINVRENFGHNKNSSLCNSNVIYRERNIRVLQQRVSNIIS